MKNTSFWWPVSALTAIMMCRMLGLFMLMPVFSVSAAHLSGATPFLIGAVLAIYGLTQAIFQIPFGRLSDRWGRRPVIALGLGLFALGSVVAALSHSMTWILVGRAIQGAGAVGSTVLAAVADFTPNECRARAMASMGLGIGLAFGLAMVLGPIITHAFGLSGLFWSMLILSVLASILLWVILPAPPKVLRDRVLSASGHWSAVFRDAQLVKLDISIFLQHAILTALFLALPIVLTKQLGMSVPSQSLFYLVVVAAGFIFMVPAVIIAEKYRHMKTVFVAGVGLMALCLIALVFIHAVFIWFALLLFLFFTGFSLMESILPSCVSKVAALENRGTAMGVYSTSQFFGIFVGGLLGGFALRQAHVTSVFIVCAVMACVWFVLSFTLSAFPYLSTKILSLRSDGVFDEQEITQRLRAHPAVYDIAFQKASSRLYLKVDSKKIDDSGLRNLVEKVNLVGEVAE